MRIPFSVIKGIDVKYPSKGDNNPLNAGIDFYIPKNAIIELDRSDPKYAATINLNERFMKTTTFINQQYIDKIILTDHIMPEIRKIIGVILKPQHSILIHSGIKMEIDFSQCGMVCNRSGLASNSSCIVGACIIDTFYNGEICFDIHNIGYKDINIEAGSKITQILIMQYISATPIYIDEKDLYSDMKNMKNRGDAGFGSTDKNISIQNKAKE